MGITDVFRQPPSAALKTTNQTHQSSAQHRMAARATPSLPVKGRRNPHLTDENMCSIINNKRSPVADRGPGQALNPPRPGRPVIPPPAHSSPFCLLPTPSRRRTDVLPLRQCSTRWTIARPSPVRDECPGAHSLNGAVSAVGSCEGYRRSEYPLSRQQEKSSPTTESTTSRYITRVSATSGRSTRSGALVIGSSFERSVVLFHSEWHALCS
jgi:hypothetical protein